MHPTDRARPISRASRIVAAAAPLLRLERRTFSAAVLACACLVVAGCAGPESTAPGDRARPDVARLVGAASDVFPDVIALPDGFAPEGLAFGRGTTFYVGSLLTGAIYRGDARTGAGGLLVADQPGRPALGIKYDPQGDRLFVAGGPSGQAYVYDATTGATLATYQLADPVDVAQGLTLVNDVVVLRDAAYFTDSFQGVVYRVPLGTHGALPAAGAVQTLPLTGDYAFLPAGFNGTGLAATPNEKRLILMNSDEGALYLVDPTTGATTRIDLAGGSLPFGDGILLADHTLYVVDGVDNRVAVVRLGPDFTSGTIERLIGDPDFEDPSAVGLFGSSLYVLNARFDVAPPGAPAPDVAFQVVRVPR